MVNLQQLIASELKRSMEREAFWRRKLRESRNSLRGEQQLRAQLQDELEAEAQLTAAE